jgi:predicted solute-binding protein
MSKRIGVPPDTYTRFLYASLLRDSKFTFLESAGPSNVVKLREGELDLAFLTPINFAQDSSEYFIVPHVALVSVGSNDLLSLHFREGLHKVKTIAVDPSTPSEIVLANVICVEQFGTEPTFLPVTDTVEIMLQKADAALLVGNAAVQAAQIHKNRLNLIEEWIGMTNLPYVHGFWCGREDGLTLPEIRTMEAAGKSVLDLPQGLSLDLDSDAEAGLSEFLRYAYYHGALPDIPEVKYFPGSSPSTAPTLN